MNDQGGVHDEHPFEVPPEERDPVRRFRGRLAAPVTIVTAGVADRPVGLTVSSLVVAEGDPPYVYFLVGSSTDLFYALEETGKFTVHVCRHGDRRLSDVFAGRFPAPGGAFASLDWTPTPWGPQLNDLGNRARCTLVDTDEETYSVMVAATLDELELDDIEDPLVYFRGAYRSLAD